MKRRIYEFMAILAGLLTSVLMRYPLVPHEQGWDSFMIHNMSQSINNLGYMKWILHPFSYMGYYPHSYASGIPVVLSLASQTSGLDIEHSILLFCFIESVLFFLLAYMAASQFTERFIFNLFTGFAYALSPGVIWFSDWTVSTRGALIMFIPLFIFLLFKSNRETSEKFLHVALFVLIITMTIHNMFVFLLIILAAYFISRLLFSIKHRVHLKKEGSTLNKSHIIGQAVFLFIFLSFLYIPVLLNMDFATYTSLDVETIKTLGFYYGAKVGFLFLFLPMGLFFLMRKKRKGLPEIFLIFMALLIAPLVLSPYYVSLGFLFIFIMLCVYAVLPLIKRNPADDEMKRRVKAVLMALLIVSMAGWAFQSKIHLISTKEEAHLNPDYCEDSLYEANIVLKHIDDNTESAFISNDYTLHGRISAYTEKPNIVDRMYLINDYVDPADMQIVRKHSVYSWFDDGPYEDAREVVLEYKYWSPLRGTPSERVINDLKYKYNIKYYVENAMIPRQMNYYNKGIIPSGYFGYLDDSEYILYSNEKVNIRYFR